MKMTHSTCGTHHLPLETRWWLSTLRNHVTNNTSNMNTNNIPIIARQSPGCQAPVILPPRPASPHSLLGCCTRVNKAATSPSQRPPTLFPPPTVTQLISQPATAITHRLPCPLVATTHIGTSMVLFRLQILLTDIFARHPS